MNAVFPASTTTLSETECQRDTAGNWERLIWTSEQRIRCCLHISCSLVLSPSLTGTFCKGELKTGRYSASLPQLKVFLFWFWVSLRPRVSRPRHVQGQTDWSDMELQQGRSILHRCARSGDVVHAGLVVTLLIGKSLAVLPYLYHSCTPL